MSLFFLSKPEDLCNGIYIARIQRFLRTEYKLFYQVRGGVEPW